MRVRDVGALVSATVGLGASLASAIDYFGAQPTFCAESGCATVRASAWSHPLGVPMPLLGIAFFAAMIVLAWVDRPRLRKALALAGAAWAALLIGLQATSIGAWCKLCMVADPAALAHAGFVIAGAATLSIRRVLASVPVAGVAMLALAAWAHTPAPPPPAPGLPDVVAKLEVPGEVNVVEFVDFECPFCRRMAHKLDAALAGKQVHLVRKMMPLDMHPGAMPAALAWCCADLQGKGDAMAAALFAADPAQLTPEGCERIAAGVGCDVGRYRRDLDSPEVAQRVASDLADARAADVHSLPTLFINQHRFVGDVLSVDGLTQQLRVGV